MRQWYIRFKAGNFENGYYEIGENFDLVKDLCKSEFIKDCKALGFTPITAESVSYTHLTLPTICSV